MDDEASETSKNETNDEESKKSDTKTAAPTVASLKMIKGTSAITKLDAKR